MSIRGLTRTQLEWAQRIVNRVKARNFGADGRRIAKIALMTALTESALYMYANRHNPASLKLPHDKVGQDHGSVGLFQQQVGGAPYSTANWGTTAELMDAATSTDKFVDALRRFNWKRMTNGQAAQRVQVSAFPDRYDFYDGWAQDLVDAMWNANYAGLNEEEYDMPLSSEDVKKIWDEMPSSIIRRIGRYIWVRESSVNGLKWGDMLRVVYNSVRVGKKGVRHHGELTQEVLSRLNRIEAHSAASTEALKALANTQGLDGDEILATVREAAERGVAEAAADMSITLEVADDEGTEDAEA